VKMIAPFKDESDDGPVEVRQHKLIDVEYQMHDVALYLANLDKEIPLGRVGNDERWPYPQLEAYIHEEDGLLDYLEAWGEVFLGYSAPKTADAVERLLW